MSHKKPVGLDGSLRHETGPGIDERTFNRHVEPKQKDLIEADIAATFSALAGGSELSQLAENDLDFLWERDGLKAKIEFTELVLANPPYRESGQSALIWYKPWAEKFEDLVRKKASKQYGDRSEIDLLVYTTHFAYHGNSFCVDLAAEHLRHGNAGGSFSRIYYLEYRGVASTLSLLKPYRAPLKPSVRREYEGMWYSNMNFAEGVPVSGGTRFEVAIPGAEGHPVDRKRK